MRLFYTVGIALAFIGIANAIDVYVQWNIQPEVYACSEVTKSDPLNVQKKCRK
jgi:hypothetical protein